MEVSGPNLYNQRSTNISKTWFLMIFFVVFVVGICFFLAQYYNNPLFLYIGFCYSLISSFVSYFFSAKLALATSGAREVARQEEPELHRIVENLSIAAGIPRPKVYIIEDVAMNAFATGRNPDNAAVAVTRGLLEGLDKAELEGVIAHELAHIGNRDILLMSVVSVLVGFISLVADFFARGALFSGGSNDDSRGNMVAIVVGIAFMILSPLVAMVIQLAISRKREFLADATGALITRYPEGLARALEKISAQGIPTEHATNATAHMYISNPFSGSGKFFSKLFATHPPTEQRIAKLRGMS